MIIAHGSGEDKKRQREALYINTIRECQVSMERRRAVNRRLRNYHLTGTDTGLQVRRNKISEWVSLSSSYCYAPEFTKLVPVLTRSYGGKWLEEIDALREEVQDLYTESGIDEAFSEIVTYAHVYGSMFGKVLVSDQHVVLETIPDPSDLGVYRENVTSLDKQEAIVHKFEMDLAQFERLVRQGMPNKADADALVEAANSQKYRGTSQSLLASATPRIILATASPNLIGAASPLASDPAILAPNVDADVVTLNELWIRDDMAVGLCRECRKRETALRHQQGPFKDHDYEASGDHEWEWRKVLALGETGDDILWSTLNPQLRQRQPIRQLRLEDSPGYIWGASSLELYALIPLQVWGEDLMGKHMNLLDLQLDPPIAIMGMSNVDGERAKLLRQVGGTFSMAGGPGTDIKRLAPETPPDTMGVQQQINSSFNEAGGLPQGSQSAQDPNVRSAGQVTAGAMLSSPRTTRRAMRTEKALAEIMTDALLLRRRISRDPLYIGLPEPDPEQQAEQHQAWQEKPYREVLLSQLPDELAVRVSAHSASPLFREQHKQDALVLKREGVIDGETMVEMYSPPMAEVVRQKAKRISAAQAKMRERAVKVKETEAAAKKEKAERASR